MQFPAAFRLLFPCKGGDSLCQFPERGPACHSVVRIVVHQQFFHLASFVFQQGSFLHQILQFLVEIHVYFRCSLNFDGLLHDGVFAVQSFGQVGNSRYGGLRVQFVGLLGEGQGFRQSASKVYLPHDGLPDHPVQARPVEQERPHIDRSVAIVGCGEACSCEDDDRSVLTGGYLYRSGQDCLTPYFRVVHIGIGHDRPLSSRLTDESGQDIHRVQPTVGVRQYAPDFHSYRPYQYPCTLGPSRMLVQDGGAQLFLPNIPGGKLAQVFGGNAHLLRNLAYGVAVQVEVPFGHCHLYPSFRFERDNGAFLATLAYPDGSDEILRDPSLTEQTVDGVHDIPLPAFYHSPYLVDDYLVESLLFLYRCSGRHDCCFHIFCF